MRRSRFARWVNGRGPSGTICLVVAAVMALGAWAGHDSVAALRARGQHAEGVVVDVRTGKDRSADVRDTPPGGREMVVEVPSGPNSPAIGDVMPLLYDPEAPDVNVVDARLGPDPVVPWIMTAGAVVLMVVAASTYAGLIDWERVGRALGH